MSVKMGKLVHNSNGLVGYKGDRVITMYGNVQISYTKFISTIFGKFNVDPNSVKMHYTYKFDPLMMVLLNDDEEMAQIFRFNDTCCCVYMSLNIELQAVGVILIGLIPFTRCTKFNKQLLQIYHI